MSVNHYNLVLDQYIQIILVISVMEGRIVDTTIDNKGSAVYFIRVDEHRSKTRKIYPWALYRKGFLSTY